MNFDKNDRISHWSDDRSARAYTMQPSYSYSYLRHSLDIHELVKPLAFHLREYDTLRVKLERNGGSVTELNAITRLLHKKIALQGTFSRHEVCLAEPGTLRSFIMDIGAYDSNCAIRRLPTYMPVYYICRIQRDYWSAYSLIVEDIYRSPGYPIMDERFVKLMETGHESYFLKLAQFRQPISIMLEQQREPKSDRYDIDLLLYLVGRHVLQSAWHEDQQLGLAVAKCFSLQQFQQAMELLYLCLNGELCELRNFVNERMVRFFDVIYPQPAIKEFLKQLPAIDGKTLYDLPQRALKNYIALSKAFNLFLRTEVQAGIMKSTVPLYKLVFAHFHRLEVATAQLKSDPQILKNKTVLEAEAEKVVAGVLQ